MLLYPPLRRISVDISEEILNEVVELTAEKSKSASLAIHDCVRLDTIDVHFEKILQPETSGINYRARELGPSGSRCRDLAPPVIYE